MSELKKYECTVLIDASCGVTVEASSPEEAAELAENAAAEQGAGRLCHQCSNHTECGDSYAVIVYEDDKEILDTDHRSKLLAEAQSQLAALREELASTKTSLEAVTLNLSRVDDALFKKSLRLADAERRNVDQSNYLREALKRINVNQHHAFCLALDDFINTPALNPKPEAASHE